MPFSDLPLQIGESGQKVERRCQRIDVVEEERGGGEGE